MMKQKSKSRRKDPNVYPPGWDRQRVQAVIGYYDKRRDQDVLNEASTSTMNNLVWVEIPQELVPQVQKLIQKYRKTA